MSAPIHGRMPRAHLDPIMSVDDALAVFRMQMSDPPTDETLVMLLDDQHCGSTLITVSGTRRDDQLVEVAEAMAIVAASLPHVASIVLARVMPQCCVDVEEIELWCQLDDVVDTAGLVLIDWLIIGPWGTVLPRALLGERSRWPADAA